MTINRNLTARSSEVISPLTVHALRWNASALIWPNNHIEVATFRNRLALFVQCASDEQVIELAKRLEL